MAKLKVRSKGTNKSRERFKGLMKDLRTQRYLFLMIAPAIIMVIIFNYLPMYGATISFKDFNPRFGIIGSPWVGLKHFRKLFSNFMFFRVFKNTLTISVLNILIGFPAPILFALFLNEVKNSSVKRVVQTISYLPHFLSWVIIGGFITSILSPSKGILPLISSLFGYNFDSLIIADPKYFRIILVLSSVWKEIGWGSIIYLATLTTIDQGLFDAADIDGAGRFKKIWYITIPALLPTIVTLFILRVGSILGSNFEQIYVLISPSVYSVGDVISTYVYREGIGKGNFSYTSAVGLFQSVIGFILVITTNKISKKFGNAMW